MDSKVRAQFAGQTHLGRTPCQFVDLGLEHGETIKCEREAEDFRPLLTLSASWGNSAINS